MPCSEPDPTSDTTNETISHLINMCCEMGGVLDEYNLLNSLNTETYNWYVDHKKRDKEKKYQELTTKLSNLCLKYDTLDTNINDVKNQIESIKEELTKLNTL